MVAEMCACGLPLHYSSPIIRAFVDRLVAEFGEFVIIETPDGQWYVPRHYIALHGLLARELPELALRYGFERADPAPEGRNDA